MEDRSGDAAFAFKWGEFPVAGVEVDVGFDFFPFDDEVLGVFDVSDAALDFYGGFAACVDDEGVAVAFDDFVVCGAWDEVGVVFVVGEYGPDLAWGRVDFRAPFGAA